MKTQLSNTDRVGTLIGGAGLIGYAIYRGSDPIWIPLVFGLLGLAFLVGGLCGT